jgi:hypothetical protein
LIIGVHSFVVVVGDVDRATQQAHDEALLLDVVALVSAGERLTDRRPDEERAEHVEDRAEVLDDGRADEDEQAAQDERDDDAHHQHLLLIAPRHRELRHDQHEHEKVVDREAVLGEPAGDELTCELAAGEDPHEAGEDERERHVEHDPQRRLLRRGDVRALEDQQQVCEEDERQPDERADLEPEGEGEVHAGLSGEGV